MSTSPSSARAISPGRARSSAPAATATVTASEAGIVFAMCGADFAKLASDIPELHDRIEAALGARLPAD